MATPGLLITRELLTIAATAVANRKVGGIVSRASTESSFSHRTRPGRHLELALTGPRECLSHIPPARFLPYLVWENHEKRQKTWFNKYCK